MTAPNEFQTYIQAAEEYFAAGDYSAACEAYHQVAELAPISAHDYYNWGYALAYLRKYEEAVRKFREAVELEPTYAPAFCHLGGCLARLSRFEEAIIQLQKAIELDPKLFLAHFNYAFALEKLKRYDEALKHYRQSHQADPDIPYALHNIATLLMRQGRYPEGREKWQSAREAYQQAREKKTPLSQKADFLAYYALMLREIFGELEEAKAQYEAGLALEPEHSEILSGLVSLYLDMQEQDREQRAVWASRARQIFNRVRKIWEEKWQTDKDFATFLKLGALLLKMEEYEKAEDYLKCALTQTPSPEDGDLARINHNLGVFYISQELFEKAIPHFKAAHRQDPDNLHIWSNLAVAYFKNGQQEKAEKEYHRILRITHGSLESHIGLGEIYSVMGDAGDEDRYHDAIHHFSQALDLSKEKKGSIILTNRQKAVVLYSRGYARVKLYENSKGYPEERLLTDAEKDFKTCHKNDPDHHKAARSCEKIKKALRYRSPLKIMEKSGPPFIFFLSLFIFVASSIAFFRGKPAGFTPVYYALFWFGSLLFMIAGLSLPQILKLKVGGLELEKSTVSQIPTPITFELEEVTISQMTTPIGLGTAK
jgi:tetratricopeptide (TPR) repeat protein